MRSWAILLGVAAGFGPVAEEAFADRGRRNHSSAQQHRPQHHQSRPQHYQSRPQNHHHRPNHARPHGHSHHHHWRSPAIVVAPAFGLGYYAAPGYFYAPAPMIEAPPVVAAPPAVHPSNGGGYWYFCPDSRAYYPYVLECPSNWLRVLPN